MIDINMFYLLKHINQHHENTTDINMFYLLKHINQHHENMMVIHHLFNVYEVFRYKYVING